MFTATACDPAVRNELQRSLKDAQQAAKIDAITTDRLIDQVATAVAHQLMDAYAAKAAARDPRFAQPPAAPAAGATTPTTGTSPPADGTSLGMAALELSSLIPSTAVRCFAVLPCASPAYSFAVAAVWRSCVVALSEVLTPAAWRGTLCSRWGRLSQTRAGLRTMRVLCNWTCTMRVWCNAR